MYRKCLQDLPSWITNQISSDAPEIQLWLLKTSHTLARSSSQPFVSIFITKLLCVQPTGPNTRPIPQLVLSRRVGGGVRSNPLWIPYEAIEPPSTSPPLKITTYRTPPPHSEGKHIYSAHLHTMKSQHKLNSWRESALGYLLLPFFIQRADRSSNPLGKPQLCAWSYHRNDLNKF